MPLTPLAIAKRVSGAFGISQPAIRESVRLLEDDLVAAIDAHDPGERRLGGERVELVSASVGHAPDATAALAGCAAWFPRRPLEQTEHGLVAKGDGWFVAERPRLALVLRRRPRSVLRLRGRAGVRAGRHQPPGPDAGRRDGDVPLGGRPGGLPRRRGRGPADRRGRGATATPWDFVHCPPGTKHTIVGAGTGPCVVLAVGAREHQDGPDWGGYTGRRGRARHGASVEKETNVPDEAYAPSGRASARASRRRTARAGCPTSDLARPSRSTSVCEHVFVLPAATILHADLDAFFASVEQRDDPSASRQARDRRRRRRPRGELRGEGVRRSRRRWAAGRRGGCARTRSSSRRGCPRTRRRARPCSSSSRTRRRWSRGSRSTRRFSTSAGSSGSQGPGRDRSAAAAPRPRGGRAPDHGRRRAHEVPREGGERGREAEGAASRRARRRARVPPSAARRAAVGRRARHGREAARPRATDGRPGRRSRRGPARLPPRPRVGAPAARARTQPRPRPRPDRPASALDRIATRAGAAAEVVRGDRLVSHRDRRPRRPAAADRPKAVPHGRSPASLRRLHSRDAVADDASID